MCTVKIISSDDTHCLRTYCKHWSPLTLTDSLNFSIWIKSKLSDIFMKQKSIRSSGCVKIFNIPAKMWRVNEDFYRPKVLSIVLVSHNPLQHKKACFALKSLIPNMAEFAAKCDFFAQKYGMWFSNQQDAQVAFDIFSFGRTDLCYPELFLKAISRAMKSASRVRIGQIVHHTVPVWRHIVTGKNLGSLVQISLFGRARSRKS